MRRLCKESLYTENLKTTHLRHTQCKTKWNLQLNQRIPTGHYTQGPFPGGPWPTPAELECTEGWWCPCNVHCWMGTLGFTAQSPPGPPWRTLWGVGRTSLEPLLLSFTYSRTGSGVWRENASLQNSLDTLTPCCPLDLGIILIPPGIILNLFKRCKNVNFIQTLASKLIIYW